VVRIVLFTVVITAVAGWWNVLRIVENDHWPIPPDAVSPDQAHASTEAFMQRDDPRRDDVAIAYAPSTASDV
jgi:hypothetical protein